MDDMTRMETLMTRLRFMRGLSVPDWQRSIHEVAIRALEAEITRLSERIRPGSLCILTDELAAVRRDRPRESAADRMIADRSFAVPSPGVKSR